LAHADERHQMAAVLDHVPAVRQLDFLCVDFFKSRDERERDRLWLYRSGPEDKQRRARPGRRRRLGLGSLRCGQLRSHIRAERLRDAVRVDDHDHGAVAENGVPGEHRDMAQFARHRLHDDFFGVCFPHRRNRSLLDIGFTTISSVWKTPSTTMPKVWLPTWVTTMNPPLISPVSLSRPNN